MNAVIRKDGKYFEAQIDGLYQGIDHLNLVNIGKRIYGIGHYRDMGYKSLNALLRSMKLSLSMEDEILSKMGIERIYIGVEKSDSSTKRKYTKNVDEKEKNTNKVSNKAPEKVPGMSDNEYIKAFNAWWWKDFNKTCKKCDKDCKNSWQVELVFCPKFKKVA